MYIYVYICIYNAKRESMKDCKCFLYQYSEFHIFTSLYYKLQYNGIKLE